MDLGWDIRGTGNPRVDFIHFRLDALVPNGSEVSLETNSRAHAKDGCGTVFRVAGNIFTQLD